MASDLVKNLINAGVHFGHRTSRWNPKMGPYIFGKRNQIHIIDIRETVKGILRARKFLAKVVADGLDVLFVGTKRQARPAVLNVCETTRMHYVIERWLGGTLTNFRTIRSRLARLEQLEAIEAEGQRDQYSKKMQSMLARERRKIKRNLEGIRRMNRLPGAMVVIDAKREHNACREARKLGIPVVALLDTDSDPDEIDIPIPANDDAMRAIDLILQQLGESIQSAVRARPTPDKDQGGERPGRRSSRVMARSDEEVAAAAPAEVPPVDAPADSAAAG